MKRYMFAVCGLLPGAPDAAWAQPPAPGTCAAQEVRPCAYCLPAPLSLDQGEGEQRCAQGTWELSCQGAGPTRDQVELLGDDGRLRHEQGQATPGHGWRVPPQALPAPGGGRLVQTGPGQALPPGRYLVEFSGVIDEGPRDPGRARLGFSVADSTTGKVLAQGQTSFARAPARGAFRQRLVFDNPGGCHALDLRVSHLGGSAVELRRTTVEPAGPAHAALAAVNDLDRRLDQLPVTPAEPPPPRRPRAPAPRR